METQELIWLYPRGQNRQLAEHFALSEFHCKCDLLLCPTTLVHHALPPTAEILREMMGRPLVISSAFRCPIHNQTIGGKPGSYHPKGMALDIVARDTEGLEKLARCASLIHAIGGVGMYPGRSFVHIDVRPRIDNKQVFWEG